MDNLNLNEKLEIPVDMNPLNGLNAEVIEEIFQYLTGKELLQSSLVSQSWYEFIADSIKCMKKVKILISIDGLLMGRSDVGLECLKKSKRKYQNLMMYKVFDSKLINDTLDILSQPARQWKRIEMRKIMFTSQEDFQSIMKCTQNTVEVLHLEQLKFFDFNEESQLEVNYCCPKLKELNLYACQSFNEIYIISKSLKTLNLISDYGFVKATVVAGFQKFLSSNNHLQTLLLSGNIITQIFCDDISNSIHFQLKELKVINFNVDKFHNRATIENNFNLFLKTQLNTEKIFLGEWMGTKVLETVFNEMMFLKDLTIMELARAPTFMPTFRNGIEEPQVVRTDVFNFKTNPSIVKLDYQDIRGNIFTMKTLLEAAPNLRSFSTYSMNQEMLQMLANMITGLEHLSVSFFDANDIVYQPIFSKLKDFASLRVEEELIRSITLKTPIDRSHFENVIYNCFIFKNSPVLCRNINSSILPFDPSFDFTSSFN